MIVRSTFRKPDIPFLTDAVCKLEAVGKETAAKLQDLHTAVLALSGDRDASLLQDFTDKMPCVNTSEHLPKHSLSLSCIGATQLALHGCNIVLDVICLSIRNLVSLSVSYHMCLPTVVFC